MPHSTVVARLLAGHYGRGLRIRESVQRRLWHKDSSFKHSPVQRWQILRTMLPAEMHTRPTLVSTPSGGLGWCNAPNKHFDVIQPIFQHTAAYKAGIVPVMYTRIACKRKRGIKFTTTGNAYFNLVLVTNVGGAGDVVAMWVKGSNHGEKWLPMVRNWCQNWQTNGYLQGQGVSFKVITSNVQTVTSFNVAPKSWSFVQTFVGRQFGQAHPGRQRRK
ncbi:unnamed protein product [Linum tenue]|uniref:Expansin n=4 Tax=Linum tenue TaxID=586396 RepID=A0AAV0HHM8_9ROSI|nr:unnamed protein product [Linum tenue]